MGHFTTNGQFKLHGITVELDNVTIQYTEDEDGIYAKAIGAIKKTLRRGEVNLEEDTKYSLIDYLNEENDDLIQILAEGEASEQADYESDMKAMTLDYWNSQFSRSDMVAMRRG